MCIDVLAVGAHPDDVEMIAGGTLAKLAGRGKSFAILDLTRGEMGSRGTPETRREEAGRAAEILGATERITLDLGDARLRDTEDNRRQVIEVIRRLRPRLVMGHYWDDLHPDHVAAGQILRAVMYPSGFANYPADGAPYRPNEYLFFMAHTPFTPSFVVDITESFERKMEAVRCYASQFHREGSSEPATLISHPGFLKRLEARARYFGSLIEREFGEPFLVTRAIPMDDPVEHYGPFTKIHPGTMETTA